MDDRARIDLLDANLGRQLHWIAAADTKAGFAFTFSTALLGVLAASVPKDPSAWGVAPAIFASFAAAFTVAALLFLTFASFPRTEGPARSMVYCGGIAQCNIDQFRAMMSDVAVDAYCVDLAEQCHRNAQIAANKFAWIQRALVCLYLAVLPWALAIWTLYGRRK